MHDMSPIQLAELERQVIFACNSCDIKALRAALDAGAPVDRVTDFTPNEPKQPIHLAAMAGFTEGVELLFARGAEIHAAERKNLNTALHLSVLRLHPETAQLLIELGADMDKPNRIGNSARDVAAWGDQEEEAEIRMLPVLEMYDTLPSLSLEGNWSKADLFRRDAKGIAPLDNPLVWRHFDFIAGELLAQGDPLTLDDLLQENAAGNSYLLEGAKRGHLPEMIRQLNLIGDQVQTQELLLPDQKPGPVLQQALRFEQVGTLFGYENWQGADVSQVKALARALPSDAKEQVDNLHGLLNQLQRETHSSKMQGRG